MRIIRFLLLCICLIGIIPAKAEHVSYLQSVDLSTNLIPFEQDMASSILHCTPNTTSPHPQDFTYSMDLSHAICVNSFSLRFAQGNFNSDELIPDYVKVFEFSEVSLASSARHYVERFTPQHQWMMQTKSQSLRLSSWKDSNLQYIPQQYAHLFA